MEETKINYLIACLLALQGQAKNVHYNTKDYGIHLFADRVQEDIDDFMDELKENYLLAHGHKVKSSSVYLAEASTYVKDNNDLLSIKPILIKCLTALEQVQNMSMGDNDLLGRIGDNLQNSLGLLNMLTGDLK